MITQFEDNFLVMLKMVASPPPDHPALDRVMQTGGVALRIYISKIMPLLFSASSRT